MNELIEYIDNSDWTERTNEEKPGDICLFVKEFWIPKGIDPTLRSFTVTFTVVEEPFGDYAEYVPLSRAVSGTWYAGTEAILLDSNDMSSGLWTAIETIDTQLSLFLATYGNITYEDDHQNWEAAIEARLQRYCAEVIQWYLTPSSQGGAGQEIDAHSLKNLAALLGFESEWPGIEDRETEAAYSIRSVSKDAVEFWATPLDDSFIDGPLFTGRIDLKAREIRIVRNPVYN